VLQDLCPSCGADWLDDSRACPACGFDGAAQRAPGGGQFQVGPLGLVLLGLAGVILAIVAFGVGLQFGSASETEGTPTPTTRTLADAIESMPGPVLFAERLGDGLALHSYRSQFTADDTIAWRAEFAQPPPTDEVTVIIAWQSIRERMQLSEATITLADSELTMVASDEVPLADLVPTAGLYSVTYYGGDTKLAEGVFELLPPEQ
jgi:hypothetical protein